MMEIGIRKCLTFLTVNFGKMTLKPQPEFHPITSSRSPCNFEKTSPRMTEQTLWIASKVFVFRIKRSLGARVMLASYVDAGESVELTFLYCVELIGLDPWALDPGPWTPKKNMLLRNHLPPKKFTPFPPPFKICRKRKKTDNDFMFENASGEIDKSEKHFNPPPPTK